MNKKSLSSVTNACELAVSPPFFQAMPRKLKKTISTFLRYARYNGRFLANTIPAQ